MNRALAVFALCALPAVAIAQTQCSSLNFNPAVTDQVISNMNEHSSGGFHMAATGTATSQGTSSTNLTGSCSYTAPGSGSNTCTTSCNVTFNLGFEPIENDKGLLTVAGTHQLSTTEISGSGGGVGPVTNPGDRRDPRDETASGDPGRWAYDVFFVAK